METLAREWLIGDLAPMAGPVAPGWLGRLPGGG